MADDRRTRGCKAERNSSQRYSKITKKMYINKELRILYFNNKYAKESTENFVTPGRTTDDIEEDCHYNGLGDINIVAQNYYCKKHKKQKEYKLSQYAALNAQDHINPLSDFSNLLKTFNLPVFYQHYNENIFIFRNIQVSGINKKITCPFNTEFIVLFSSRCELKNQITTNCTLKKMTNQSSLQIHSCQFNEQEKSTYSCCSSNSDAMIQFIKCLCGLYISENYDNCNCNHCYNWPQVDLNASETELIDNCNCNHCYHWSRIDLDASETGLINNLTQADLSLELETAAKKKHRKKDAAAAETVSPFQGKSPQEKENYVEAGHKIYMMSPEGRRPDYDLIAKMQKSPKYLHSECPPESAFSKKEKHNKAVTADIIGLTEQNCVSEKYKKNKIDCNVPQTSSGKGKESRYGATTLPFQDLYQKIQHKQADLEKVVTEGKEKVLRLKSKILKKSKVAGLLTPLQCNETSTRTKKGIDGLAMKKCPLYEGNTPPKQNLTENAQANLGLPLEPNRMSEIPMCNKAVATLLKQSIERNSKSEKKGFLKSLCDMNGRCTPSGKALNTKNKKRICRKLPIAIPSEKLRKAKAAGYITPLEGKSRKQKENIYTRLAMQGIPLLKGKTLSEKKLIVNVRADLGLPPEPKRVTKRHTCNEAIAVDIIQPLDGKSNLEKESILKAQHKMGILLPEGRTPTEKALSAKVKTVPKETQKLGKLKAVELFTPSEEKYMKQKELIEKFTAYRGVPPELITAREKERYHNRALVGVEPLEGKTGSKRKTILPAQDNMSSVLPERRTATENPWVAKVKAMPREASGVPSDVPSKKRKAIIGIPETSTPLPDSKTPSVKYLIQKIKANKGISPEAKSSCKTVTCKAKPGKISIMVAGKGSAQKEKIAKGLVQAESPKGKKASEIRMTRTNDKRTQAGLEQERERTANVSKMLKSGNASKISERLITPFESNTSKQIEKIFMELVAAGLLKNLPSEKDMLQKSLKETFHSPKHTITVKREKLQTKSKKLGVAVGIGINKGITSDLPSPDVMEYIKNIIITKITDYEPSCAKKKIKHSDVKVSSPHITSWLSLRPGKCLPGVERAITNHEGIKVKIGRITGTPSYHVQSSCNSILSKSNNGCNYFYTTSDSKMLKTDYSIKTGTKKMKTKSQMNSNNTDELKYIFRRNYAFRKVADDYIKEGEFTFNDYNSSSPLNIQCSKISSKSSYDSINIVETDLSLSLYSKSYSTNSTTNIISLVGSSFPSNASHYMLNDNVA